MITLLLLIGVLCHSSQAITRACDMHRHPSFLGGISVVPVKGMFDTPIPSGVKVYDMYCPIYHGPGQGNGGYMGDSGECSCGYIE